MATPFIANTSAGPVRGLEIADGIAAWRGIPYAAPPVGPLRLRPPQPPEPWSGARDATSYQAPAPAPPLPQTASVLSDGGSAVQLPPPSEDCLYLNVTAPAGAVRRPVLVWIHGGGYQVGAGTDMAEDGSSFARSHGLVVVSFGYRLGALGFLAVPGEEHSGAFGLHDQIAVLRWIRDNIEAFGGDPGNVTIYGVSAGAKSVANLLASPLARGLVHRAASSSGGADHVATPAQAANVARSFFRELGTGPERIREVDAQDILHAQSAFGDIVHTMWLWRPAIDGLALTARPLDAVAAGSAAGVALLAQHCVEECALFQLIAPDTAEQADRVLADYFGAAARAEILDAYAEARPDLAEDPVRLRVAIMTDERYAVPTTRLADAQCRYGPVWRSRYDGPLTGLPPVLAPSGTAPAVHGADGMQIWSGGSGLAGVLHDVWGAFAGGSAPGADGLPAWPGYDTGRRATMVFDSAGSAVVDDPQAAQRRIWDGRVWESGTWWPSDG